MTPDSKIRVAVIDTNVSMHSQKLVLSGRTEADRKVSAFARTGGIVTEVRVHRGSHVKKGDIVCDGPVGTRRGIIQHRDSQPIGTALSLRSDQHCP